MVDNYIEKNKLIFLFSTIGFLVLFFFGLDNVFLRDSVKIGIIEISISIIFVSNIILLKITNKTEIASHIVMLLLFTALLFMYVSGGIGGKTGVLWFFTFPIVSMFLFGERFGFFWIASLLTSTLLVRLFHTTPFSLLETRQLIFAVIVVTFLVRIYVKLIEGAYKNIVSKSEELKKYIKSSEMSTKIIFEKNNDLEQIKSAVLNLLEDSKKLEMDLKLEKESVEKKIQERTAELVKAKDEISKGWLLIQEEKAKLLASIETLNRAYVLLDLEGKVILTNKRVEEILGKTDGGWTLAKLQEKMGENFDLPFIFKDCLNTKKSTTIDKLGMRNRYLHMHMGPVFLSQKEVIGVLMVIGDITDEKALERSKEEFFSIASHELRTPLTAIRGNASLIKQYFKEKLKDKELVEMVDDIEESSIRLIDIVNDFLNIGRLEQGRMQFKLEEFDLSELVKDSLKQYQVTGSRQKLYLNFEEPKEKMFVRADKERTRQTIINLIGNGIKFTENGGVTISTKVSNDSICCYVTDTGRGISTENQGFLFRKFQQAGDSLYTRDTTKGTGLGLYISKLMIEGMGGKIWLDKSEVGKGSTFAFCLPSVKS